MSIRLMIAPNNFPYTHGWGVYPQLATELGKRRRSAKTMLGFIDGTSGVKPSDWRYSALILEGASNPSPGKVRVTGLPYPTILVSLRGPSLTKSSNI
ncbi:hypothetical protein ACC689_20655 [Rhizobium ruizarguesonis]